MDSPYGLLRMACLPPVFQQKITRHREGFYEPSSEVCALAWEMSAWVTFILYLLSQIHSVSVGVLGRGCQEEAGVWHEPIDSFLVHRLSSFHKLGVIIFSL